MSKQTLRQRLDILYRKLDDDGRYVDANTVALVLERVPANILDEELALS